MPPSIRLFLEDFSSAALPLQKGRSFLLTQASPAAIKTAQMCKQCSTEQNSIPPFHTLVLLFNYDWVNQDIVSCDVRRNEPAFLSITLFRLFPTHFIH
jgi:hypothetical protein